MNRSIAIACLLVACGGPAAAAEAKTEGRDGVQVTTFELPGGTVGVYLPTDAAAGDRISGTVYLNPKGKGRSKLESHVLTLGDRSIPVRDGGFSLELPETRELALVSAGGKTIGRAALDLAAVGGSPVSGFSLPTLGQSGRWLRLDGPFDGDLSDTRAAIGGRDALPLVESPRGAVFVNPTDVVGPTRLELWEDGRRVAAGDYRNLEVQLSTPTTRLARGQHTTVTIEVGGLEGLQQPARLELEVTPEGVVAATGGNRQTLTVRPEQVGDDGRWAHVVDLTGLKPGSWDAIATVVVDEAPADRFALELEGHFAGWVESVRIDEAVTLQVDLGMERNFWSWIAGAAARDGEILGCDAARKVRERHAFTGGVVTEFTVPTLDASSKEPVYMTVKLEPVSIEYKNGDGRQIPGGIEPGTKKWLASNFRFELGDLPCERVAKVDSFTWKKPAQAELPSIKITLGMDDLEPWLEWIHQTPARPYDRGLLELIPPAGSEPLRLDLLEIAPLELIVSRPSAGTARHCEVTIEARTITFTGLE